MSAIRERLFNITGRPTTKGELVVIPPTLDDLAQQIRKAHDGVENALATAAECALDAGLRLRDAKGRVRHGYFEDYVALCGFSMRTAQNYMRIAKHEAEVRQLLAEKAQGRALLSMAELLKFVVMLDAKKRPKRRRKR
jgi:hypothetical protein